MIVAFFVHSESANSKCSMFVHFCVTVTVLEFEGPKNLNFVFVQNNFTNCRGSCEGIQILDFWKVNLSWMSYKSFESLLVHSVPSIRIKHGFNLIGVLGMVCEGPSCRL